MKTKEERVRDLTNMGPGTWKHNVSRRLVELEERIKTQVAFPKGLPPGEYILSPKRSEPAHIPLPEGICASEFLSHGIRAISFRGTDGNWCNVRVPEKGKYEVCWPETGQDSDWVMGNIPIPDERLSTARVHDWILAVWDTFSDEPEAPQSNPPLPPGAEEFMSDSMRALRFYDSDGAQCEVRVREVDRYEVRWAGPMWHRGGGAADPDSLTHAAYPWLQSVWAEMRKASSPEDAPAPVPQDPSLLEREKLRACVKALEDKVATVIAERDAATLRENRVSNQLRICKGIKESCQSEATRLRAEVAALEKSLAQTDILELEAERDAAQDELDKLKQSSAEERELLREKLEEALDTSEFWHTKASILREARDAQEALLARATKELDAFKKEQWASALSVADDKTGAHMGGGDGLLYATARKLETDE